MCGIAGIVSYSHERVDSSVVKRMIRIMRHRGPDDEGIFSGQHAILGHVRLSIIDVTGSKQPLSNENGDVWVTFNGEIYNYRQIRKKLTDKGHCFKTEGDTEILVHLYEEYGQEMISHLQGMFAFAIWDKQKQLLFMARDRVGIKPLYYCINKNNFIFASEIKAILQHPSISASPREESMWNYLTYQSAPSPYTLFENIYKLEPGNSLVYTKEGYHIKKYWDVPLRTHTNGQKTDVIAEVESLLLKSVKRRLISDVPVGAFLSGGIDSSLIVAMMSKLTNTKVKTYSVGFNNYASSEVSYAKSVADQYKTNHHELILDEDCFAENLEGMTWMRDGPLSQPADIPLYLLAKMASKDVKILLSGEGSDELFAGYRKYAYDRFAPLFNWLPNNFVQNLSHVLPPKLRKVEVALRSLSEKTNADRWAQWFAPFTINEKLQLLGDRYASINPSERFASLAQKCTSLDAMLYVDCKLWLPENLLERGDRMTMAASVECRVPFLDHELIEYAFNLPSNVKVKSFTGKWIIKQIAKKYLPDEIIDRPKVGFSVPLSRWFRGELREMCYDRICNRNGLLRDMFSQKILHEILDSHCSFRKDNSHKIWALLGLAIWDDVFIKTSVGKHVA